jgi:hypothetical protein
MWRLTADPIELNGIDLIREQARMVMALHDHQFVARHVFGRHIPSVTIATPGATNA